MIEPYVQAVFEILFGQTIGTLFDMNIYVADMSFYMRDTTPSKHGLHGINNFASSKSQDGMTSLILKLTSECLTFQHAAAVSKLVYMASRLGEVPIAKLSTAMGDDAVQKLLTEIRQMSTADSAFDQIAADLEKNRPTSVPHLANIATYTGHEFKAMGEVGQVFVKSSAEDEATNACRDIIVARLHGRELYWTPTTYNVIVRFLLKGEQLEHRSTLHGEKLESIREGMPDSHEFFDAYIENLGDAMKALAEYQARIEKPVQDQDPSKQFVERLSKYLARSSYALGQLIRASNSVEDESCAKRLPSRKANQSVLSATATPQEVAKAARKEVAALKGAWLDEFRKQNIHGNSSKCLENAYDEILAQLSTCKAVWLPYIVKQPVGGGLESGEKNSPKPALQGRETSAQPGSPPKVSVNVRVGVHVQAM